MTELELIELRIRIAEMLLRKKEARYQSAERSIEQNRRTAHRECRQAKLGLLRLESERNRLRIGGVTHGQTKN